MTKLKGKKKKNDNFQPGAHAHFLRGGRQGTQMEAVPEENETVSGGDQSPVTTQREASVSDTRLAGDRQHEAAATVASLSTSESTAMSKESNVIAAKTAKETEQQSQAAATVASPSASESTATSKLISGVAGTEAARSGPLAKLTSASSAFNTSIQPTKRSTDFADTQIYLDVNDYDPPQTTVGPQESYFYDAEEINDEFGIIGGMGSISSLPPNRFSIISKNSIKPTSERSSSELVNIESQEAAISNSSAKTTTSATEYAAQSDRYWTACNRW
jgi:hypothetical protein